MDSSRDLDAGMEQIAEIIEVMNKEATEAMLSAMRNFLRPQHGKSEFIYEAIHERRKETPHRQGHG